MSQGIQTFASNGVTNMFSPAMNEYFFRQSPILINSTSIPLGADFASAFSLATPIGEVQCNSPFGYGQVFNMRSPGMTSVDGLNYFRNSVRFIYTNTFYYNGGSAYSSVYNAVATETVVHSLGKTTVASQDNYGFFCLNDDGSSVVVDSKYNSYYIHRLSDGNVIRTGVATSAPSYVGIPPANIIPVRSTIVFDYPLDEPPLIFITQSSGLITLGRFNRDGNGKYVSVAVFAASSISQLGSPYGWGFWNSNTFTFNYFIVSRQKPLHGADANPWGVEVFNGSGQSIFNSMYFVPSFSAFNISLPQMTMNLSPPREHYLNIGNPYTPLNTFSGAIPSLSGVCINNFNVMSGLTNYPRFNAGLFVDIRGPVSLIGRYISVNNGQVTAQSFGTMSFLSFNSTGVALDLNANSVSTMPILTAKYAY